MKTPKFPAIVFAQKTSWYGSPDLEVSTTPAAALYASIGGAKHGPGECVAVYKFLRVERITKQGGRIVREPFGK